MNINRDVAYVYHYPLTRRLKGEPVEWALIPVELAPGRALADMLTALRYDKTHRDAFGEPVAAPAAVTLDDARARYKALTEGDKAAVARYWEANDVDLTDPDAITESIDAVVNFRDIDVEPVTRPTTPPAPTVAAKVVDEGATIDDDTLAAAGRRYGALGDTERAWVSVCAGRVRLSPDHGGVASVRRFELLRALCTLAESKFVNELAPVGISRDDIIRQVCNDQREPADIIAGLDVNQARRFAEICQDVADANVALRYQPDGRAVLEPSVLDKDAA